MKYSVNVKGRTPYTVTIERGLIHSVASYVPVSEKVVILTDTGVPVQWVDSVKDQFDDVVLISIELGEAAKSLSQLETITTTMLEAGCTRKTVLIALGGGVIGDLGGLVAALYMRGIAYVQVPTTLLAQVDSSVGSKVAVNTERMKNAIGAFYSPVAVCIDPDVLHTLPQVEFSNGMAEVIKYGMILDQALFEAIEDGSAIKDIAKLVHRTVELKASVVEEDELDQGKRQILNFGHSIAHAIEKDAKGRIPHGQAVAIGMAMMMKNTPHYSRFISVLTRYGLPSTYDQPGHLVDYIVTDKKSSAQGIHEIFVHPIGTATIKEISFEQLKDLLEDAS
jgi:3-dehydroquinate synthase